MFKTRQCHILATFQIIDCFKFISLTRESRHCLTHLVIQRTSIHFYSILNIRSTLNLLYQVANSIDLSSIILSGAILFSLIDLVSSND